MKRLSIFFFYILFVSIVHAQWSTATLSQSRELLAATSVGTKAFFAGGYNQSSSTVSIVDI